MLVLARRGDAEVSDVVFVAKLYLLYDLGCWSWSVLDGWEGWGRGDGIITMS